MKNVYDLILLILLFIFGASALHSQCSTTGPRNGNAFSSNNIIGTIPWVNPSDAITCNSVPTSTNATVNIITSVTTNYLYVRNFGFSIPPSAIICGIELKLIRKQQGSIDTNTIVLDSAIYLMNSGGLAGPNHAIASAWTNSYSTVSYGGISDNWGGGFTPSNINMANFGVAISTKLLSSVSYNTTLTPQIDQVTIEVFYTLPLPVEVINFHTINENNREVEIYWQTASEINNDYFTLERSSDGFTWTEIEEIDGAGNSNSAIDYKVIDIEPLKGINYYRLKQTDFNGAHRYSEISSIQVNPSAELDINYQPSSSSIQIIGNTTENVNVGIYDFTGKEILSKTLGSTTESQTIDIGDLASGVYIVVASSLGQSKVKKFSICQ